jgi:hypothetical protein
MSTKEDELRKFNHDEAHKKYGQIVDLGSKVRVVRGVRG